MLLPLEISVLSCQGTEPALDSEATLLAAGDIAGCDTQGDEATARILDTIPGAIATLGDNVYIRADPDLLAECFHPSWGRHKERIRPAIGHHDHDRVTNSQKSFYEYFGSAAGPPDGYYSYGLGSWHIVVLNSEIATDSSSPQLAWLKRDLRDHPSSCTLAYWYRPLFNSGANLSYPKMRPLWDVLYEAGAELVLNGHEHNYERFAPQAPNGTLDRLRGIRQFVVGTGGFFVELTWPERRLQNSEFRDGAQVGILRLTLRPSSYRWDFITTENRVLDSGAAACH